MIVDGCDRLVGIALRATGQYEIFMMNQRSTETIRVAVTPVDAWKIAARLHVPFTAEAIDA